jgi:hypothetical protein
MYDPLAHLLGNEEQWSDSWQLDLDGDGSAISCRLPLPAELGLFLERRTMRFVNF